MAETVYENDVFQYELGLNPKLVHKPALENRGDIKLFYAVYKLQNGGLGISVMTKADMDSHAREYSKGFESSYSPWKTNYEEMAKKTVIRKALKYAPLRTDFSKALVSDETVKKEIAQDMSEIKAEDIYEIEYKEVV